MRANSAAVKRPNPATSSFGGVVHGAATVSVSRPAPPARTRTTRHCLDAMSMAASTIDGIPRPLGRRVHGPSPSSRTASAAAVSDHPVDVGRRDAGVMEGAQPRLQRDRRGVVAGQPACLGGVVDADDGDVVERMTHRGQDVTPAPLIAAGIAAPCRWPSRGVRRRRPPNAGPCSWPCVSRHHAMMDGSSTSAPLRGMT